MEAVTPGCVICADTGPNNLVAQWGEMSCHLARNKGATGVVIAGNVRDTRIILRMEDFPVFTMGVVANARAGWIVNEINEIIYMPGHLRHSVRIFPGDFLFGDSDGVLAIPKDLTDEVMLRCEESLAREKCQRGEIVEGLGIEEVYRKYGSL